MENQRIKFNIGIIGNSGVGKSRLTEAYIFGNCYSNIEMNQYSDCYKKTIEINGEYYDLEVIDTPGHETYQSITCLDIRECHIIILVYDITNHKSFEDLEKWIQLVKDHRRDKCVIGLLGNKIDLYEKMEVTEEEAIKFAKNYNFPFYFSSAKTNKGAINDLVINLIEEYLRRYKKEGDNFFLLEHNLGIQNCCLGQIYFSFGERFKARVFPWYIPMYEFKKDKKSALLQ